MRENAVGAGMQVSGFSGSSVSFIRQFNSIWFAKHIAVTEVDKFVCTSKWKRESRFNFEPMRADSAISDDRPIGHTSPQEERDKERLRTDG
ncbi:MAG: hypothetical protein ACK524_21170 [Planctomyces sp.]|uniref:Uncharacterized protein n=1 Tax=Planctomyces bekefii TaxID=1653850 RepID=A0A5C6M532_9PLAN|nr:hypothetical protein E3A20_14650 [Planctomyces bekefii]